ncbi:SDR family NAD(P)-dependent oxidoreductase, partial [Polymorphospora rubra]|uniref:SDR family NAD(P)-dependent oxidoreductase n=1 Tax=Polymorphospora rubra TaxID=338584 RepID=UPI003CD0C42D
SARLSAVDVDVVEAHGTGTTLGDPIEAQALLATYGQGRVVDRPLLLGSVKSNIGHTQAAAGVAGVIKMVLAMRHGVVPATLHVDVPSTKVDWTAGAVTLATGPVPWPQTDRPRRSAVSAFGISGTNAHVIVEQGDPEPDLAAVAPTRAPAVLPWVLSARTTAALPAQAARLAGHLRARTGLSPADVGWTLATTRAGLEHRAVVVGADPDELLAGLTALADDRPHPALVTGRAGTARVALLFTGQGAQRPGMGRDLYDRFPVYADAFDRVCALLDDELPRPLREVVLAAPGTPEAALLDQTVFTQAALFAVEVALYELLASRGVRPDLVAGHSIGEVTAAYVAGVLTLPDACALVSARGRLMQALPVGGGMLALEASEEEALAVVAGTAIDVAAVNGPRAVVVAGALDQLDTVERAATERGWRVRRLPVSHAFHSRLTEPMLDGFRAALTGLDWRPPTLPVVSNLTGRAAEPAEIADPDHWVRHVREPVRFADAIAYLHTQGVGVFLEVGPDATLTAMAADTPGDPDARFVPTLRRDHPDSTALLTALAQLYVAGTPVDWATPLTDAGARTHPLDLPTYAFQHHRYWPEPATGDARTDAGSDHLDRRFWAAIERADLGELGEELRLDPDQPLSALLPRLAEWRRAGRRQSTVDGWRYRIAWRPRPVQPADRLTGTWLAVLRPGQQDHPLVTGLAARGARIVPVIAPTVDRADLAARLTGCLPDAGPVTGVLSLVSLADGPAGDALAVVQALGDVDVPAPVWWLTRGAVSVGRSDQAPAPDAAAVWGLGRVVALERPTRWGGLIDLPDDLDDRAVGRLCALLTGPDDPRPDTPAEDQAAVRSSGVFVRRLVRAGGTPADRTFRLAGTVLVTGGTGALGGHVAQWAVRSGAEHVVLTSRRGEQAPGADDLAGRLRDSGARVTVAACDVADRAALAGLLAGLAERGEPVRAVLHAAGAPQFTPLTDVTPDEWAAVLRAKVDGAAHLADLLDGEPLDAFVVFSSIAAVWGSAGQVAYAAANTAVDALVARRRSRGLPGTAVAWGPWAGAGMAAGEARDQLARRGLPAMAPELAVVALQQALDHDDASVVVADVDWARFAASFTALRSSPLLAEIPAAQPAPDGAAPAADGTRTPLGERLAALPPTERDAVLLDLVRSQAAVVLGHPSVESVPADRAFQRQGFDSLTAVELRNRLTAETGLALPTTLVFDHPTPQAVAALLHTALLGGPREVTPVDVAAPVDDDPIVIVGMACRLPGDVDTTDAYWDLLTAGRDGISGFPLDRGWDDFLAGAADTSFAHRGGFLHGAAGFDAEFFGISPREAVAMDPQQRLLLEVSWEAVESAGIDPSGLRGARVGVFAGASFQGYAATSMGRDREVGGHLLTGNATSVLSGRVAYTFGFEGPALT